MYIYHMYNMVTWATEYDSKWESQYLKKSEKMSQQQSKPHRADQHIFYLLGWLYLTLWAQCLKHSQVFKPFQDSHIKLLVDLQDTVHHHIWWKPLAMLWAGHYLGITCQGKNKDINILNQNFPFAFLSWRRKRGCGLERRRRRRERKMKNVIYYSENWESCRFRNG